MTKLIVKAQVALNSFKRNESGATLIEYSLLIGLITVVAVVAVGAVGLWVNTQWEGLETTLTTAG
jgi:pilus assembly protein Flp/PilA